MNVVHFSVTPLAGSPIRIVNAINAHTRINAELIVLNPDAYGARTFEGGYSWNQNRDKCLELIEAADILHIHHYFPLDSTANPFGFNFSTTRVPVIRQFHSHPLTISHGDKALARSIVYDKTPSLVIAQYHERLFPLARIVPNIVPINDDLYTPCNESPRKVIAYSPSVKTSAWATARDGSRFDTKGAPETIHLLSHIKSRHKDIQLQIITDKPHTECLRLKRGSSLAIDDLITGSYHISSLETLSMGKPTLCYIDRRTESVIKEITGCAEIPWVNTKIEEAKFVINAFLADPDLIKSFGIESRNWMERYWNDAILISYYENAYVDLLNAPQKYSQPRFNNEDARVRWITEDQFEIEWYARKLQATSGKLRNWLRLFAKGS